MDFCVVIAYCGSIDGHGSGVRSWVWFLTAIHLAGRSRREQLGKRKYPACNCKVSKFSVSSSTGILTRFVVEKWGMRGGCCSGNEFST